MTIKDKIIYLNQQFEKGLNTKEDGSVESLNIEGYANCTCVDRTGDVIPMTAWTSGIENYLKNPVILAYHNHSEPIGRMMEHRIDDKGLWIKARISAAAEDVFNLVKDGVLTAFSVGFRVKDAVYDAVTDLFIIKELELLEISVVSVPANQESLFSLSKAFENAEEYSNFKSQFAEKKEETKELSPPASQDSDKSNKEWNMDPKELEQLLAKTAADAAAAVIKAQTEAKAKTDAEAAEKADLDARIKSAIQVEQSGAEKLLAEVEKRFAEQADSQKKAIEGLEAVLKEKAAEIDSIQKSKMSFNDKTTEQVDYTEREKAVLLAKILQKNVTDTKFGKNLVEKASISPHQPTSGVTFWETEVSNNMENEIRRRLVMAPLFRNLAMQTNVMKIPVNPEAGFATWMSNTVFGSASSAGATQLHTFNEVTLSAYKVATNEYMNYEEEEDSLIILLPMIRDAMIRRVAKAVDKAFLLGLGVGADPVKGVGIFDAASAVTSTFTAAATIASLRALRKDLGAWGLDPSELRYVVSTEVYYDLLDDTLFQTIDKVGAAATLLTGQVGSIGNTPVLVSDAFASKITANAGGTTYTASTNTNLAAICVAPGNFIVGNQRGLRFDTQDLVETQRKVLVASLRTGLQQISTANGAGVSTLRWT
jgi:HK97 family phage prohead protease/HK97 family phage major capsid protein